MKENTISPVKHVENEIILPKIVFFFTCPDEPLFAKLASNME